MRLRLRACACRVALRRDRWLRAAAVDVNARAGHRGRRCAAAGERSHSHCDGLRKTADESERDMWDRASGACASCLLLPA
eukprot:2573604-Pleurochrysis_carterae.AAC.1